MRLVLIVFVPLFVVNLGERNGADATSAVDKNVDVAALPQESEQRSS